MTTGIEAAGDAMTGAVIGRAVEPGHGEGTRGAHGTCINCGAVLAGPYCQNCGQAAHIHRTIGGIGHEILHGVFHFEGKIWRTLPMLAWKPGELTRRYIHGERARVVSPMAMFLFSAFLMFAIVSAIAGEMHAPEVPERLRGQTFEQLQVEQKRLKAEIKDLRAKRDAARETKNQAVADKLAARIDVVDKEIDAIDTASAMAKGEGPTVANFDTGSVKLNAAIKKANENPNLLLYKLQSSAYKYSWALIPLSTPFLWLLFCWRRDLKMYDHAIFITYSLSFMSLLVVVLTVLGAIGTPTAIISLSAMIIPPLHMYRQLRGAYLSGPVSAVARTTALIMFASVVLITFLVLLLLLGIMG
jgi:hypothetical protein